MIITKVDPARWQQAQEFEREIQKKIAVKGDDWNYWWWKKFDEYNVLHKRIFDNVLEVGCGPCTNARLIIPFLPDCELYLEDPLLDYYIKPNRGINWLHAHYLKESLEKLSLADNSMNLLICINVLDHVQDAELCMAQMKRVLAPHGVLIIGQDLSNAEDYERCPDSWQDVGHPIKLDEAFFTERLTEFAPLYNKVLPREEGRNPRCHYGTLLWIGEKG